MEKWACTQLSVTLADGSTTSGTGNLSLEVTGRFEVAVELPGTPRLRDFDDGANVTGMTADGFVVQCENTFATNASFDLHTGMSTIRFSASRCSLRAIRPLASLPTRSEVYVKSARVHGRCTFAHSNSRFTLSPLPDVQDRRGGIVRATLDVEPPCAELDLANVLLALSLAQRCVVHAPMIKVFMDDDLVEVHLQSSELQHEASHPLIPRLASDLSSYFEQVLPRISTLEQQLQLGRLIYYYCLSVTESFAEIKFILASVFMEGLKFYWALNIGQKTPLRKTNGLVRGFQKGLNKKNKPVLYEFEDLLNEAFASFGCSATFTFVEDRNALFHSGAPGAHQLGAQSSWAAIEPELTVLYRQIDDVLLKILGYTGPIHRWDTPDQTDAFA